MHWQDSNAHFDIVDTVERTQREQQRVIRVFAFGDCSGPCAGKACPTPQACEQPDAAEGISGAAMLVGGALVLSILCVLAVVVQYGVHP